MLRDAWANYRDESFILQYMSPEVIRKFRLFQIADDSGKPALRVEAIHDDSAIARSAARCRGNTTCRAANPTCRSSMSI